MSEERPDDPSRPPAETPEASETPAKKKEKKKKAPKGPKLPDRDIQTWFRLTSKNLYTRRQQLDSKANILLSINAVMVTLIGTNVYPYLDGDVWRLGAMLPVTTANLTSIFMAVRAMSPGLSFGGGRASAKAQLEKRARLMTFDDFYRMEEADYVAAVDNLLNDREYLHNTLIRDIYKLGIYLSRRYRMLEIAYHVFIIGLATSAVLFVLVELFGPAVPG